MYTLSPSIDDPLLVCWHALMIWFASALCSLDYRCFRSCQKRQQQQEDLGRTQQLHQIKEEERKETLRS